MAYTITACKIGSTTTIAHTYPSLHCQFSILHCCFSLAAGYISDLFDSLVVQRWSKMLVANQLVPTKEVSDFVDAHSPAQVRAPMIYDHVRLSMEPWAATRPHHRQKALQRRNASTVWLMLLTAMIGSPEATMGNVRRLDGGLHGSDMGSRRRSSPLVTHR